MSLAYRKDVNYDFYNNNSNFSNRGGSCNRHRRKL